MSGPRSLTEREPAEGVRLVALQLLGQAQEAAGRLGDAEDAEALHDFRVAIRRLRSWLRSFAPEVDDTLRKKWRRELREVVAATGGARDAEVMQGLVQAEKAALSPRHRQSADWLLSQEGTAAGPGLDPRAAAAAGFGKVLPHLTAALSRYQRVVGTGRMGRFGDTAAMAIRRQAEALLEALQAVEGPDDVERAHRARIEGKRLRYLLEPLGEVAPAAAEAVKGMKGLQDLLGDLHDVHVLAARIAEGGVRAAAEGARAMHQALHAGGEHQARAVARESLRPGLLALDRRVRDRRDALHAELARSWLRGGKRSQELSAQVAMVVEGLGRRRRRARAAGGAAQTPRTRRR